MKIEFTEEGLKKIKLTITTRLRKKHIAKTGFKGYLSYWHLKSHRAINNPDTSNFYISAQPNAGAGIGHQLANWIAGLWYAKYFGIKFAHIPFPNNSWEAFFGFGIGHPTVKELSKKGWKVRHLPIFHEKEETEVQLVKDIMSSYSGQKVVFVCEQDQFYRDQFGVMEELQKSFYSAPARNGQKLVYDSNNCNIAIHVRRGDIMADPSNPNLTMRYLSNDYFEKVLTQVVEHFSKVQDKPIHIYFFSQGKPENYPEFHKFQNLHWCLDMGAQDSFLHMVYADVLITSKSSFSYKPALLNRGIKVCPKNFWHGYPDTKDWVMVDNEGKVEF